MDISKCRSGLVGYRYESVFIPCIEYRLDSTDTCQPTVCVALSTLFHTVLFAYITIPMSQDLNKESGSMDILR